MKRVVGFLSFLANTVLSGAAHILDAVCRIIRWLRDSGIRMEHHTLPEYFADWAGNDWDSELERSWKYYVCDEKEA